MRRKLTTVVAAVAILAMVPGCGPCVPRPPDPTVTAAVAEAFLSLYLSQVDGPIEAEKVEAARELVSSILQGKVPRPVQPRQPGTNGPDDPGNLVMSPVTGKPCLFLTTEGPTPLGYTMILVAKNLVGG